MMYRKTAQRGIAALALVTILAFAGAQPAAAADLGFLDRLASFWSAVSGEESIELWETLTGWFGGFEKAEGPPDSSDRSTVIDPNGFDSTPTEGSPTAPGGTN